MEKAPEECFHWEEWFIAKAGNIKIECEIHSSYGISWSQRSSGTLCKLTFMLYLPGGGGSMIYSFLSDLTAGRKHSEGPFVWSLVGEYPPWAFSLCMDLLRRAAVEFNGIEP